MGLDNLIKLAVALAIAAAFAGRLSVITHQIQLAQFKLLQDSKASHWGSPDFLFRGSR